MVFSSKNQHGESAARSIRQRRSIAFGLRLLRSHVRMDRGHMQPEMIYTGDEVTDCNYLNQYLFPAEGNKPAVRCLADVPNNERIPGKGTKQNIP
jgi:hypothetical protein